MGALQTWLQLSDDLLSRAWGSMDRYHLAWLMVGKPKGIVRGRPMDADEEAAYVREVATQKTAALRMSLDAVDRQHMPFVGETGGGLGQGEAAPAPTVRRVDPRPSAGSRSRSQRTASRPDPRRPTRRCSCPRRDASGPRGAAGSAAGPDGAVNRRPRPRRGGGWHPAGTCAGPDRRGLPPARACGWVSASRGSSMATTGRPCSRPASRRSSSRPQRGSARTLPR